MASASKTVIELAAAVDGIVDAVDPSHNPLIYDVTHDSRQADTGVLFVAVRGANFDGHEFVPAALARGASAVCVEHRLSVEAPQVIVSDSRRALGPLAALVHGDPSASMKVIGVTGTNGKTTVTHYIESIASTSGISAGLIGTIHTRIAGGTIESAHTTPEASDFQRLLKEMLDAGTQLVAAEVSSHALEMGRVAATRFEVAAFTNLSQDHLDFHGDMERYRAAKTRLFEEYEVGTAVVNIDDSTGREIAREYSKDLLTVGRDGDVRREGERAVARGVEFRLVTPWGSDTVVAPVIGTFNLDNALMAVACAMAAGLDYADVLLGLTDLAKVPGRYEIVSASDPIKVIVDYAHTPEGIVEAIAAARSIGARRVIAVVGAGGDRDQEKRPLMGAAAAKADVAVITSDNPRTEDPARIVSAVVSGIPRTRDSVVEVDRRSAIQHGIDLAEDGDIVLVLGRGHEPVQDLGDRRVPFDDRQVAREALDARRKPTGRQGGSGSVAL
ncbi:MAG: UDP-N-acetylmuramoyl-L-alanyl-D-glutamate--2,6-diaminopimelate ligase [Acidimicrobiia bacterium]